MFLKRAQFIIAVLILSLSISFFVYQSPAEAQVIEKAEAWCYCNTPPAHIEQICKAVAKGMTIDTKVGAGCVSFTKSEIPPEYIPTLDVEKNYLEFCMKEASAIATKKLGFKVACQIPSANEACSDFNKRQVQNDIGKQFEKQARMRIQECNDKGDPGLTGVVRTEATLEAQTAMEAKVESGAAGLKIISPPEERPEDFFGLIIRVILSIVGSVGLLMFVYGGVLYMLAAGNSEQAKKAMTTMVWAALGLLAILASYSIITFILEVF